jgi:hypothetical protein
MFEAGIPWREALAMPLSESLDIAESHLDRLMLQNYRQSESVWASIAPHTTDKLPPPKFPEFE